MHAIGWDYPAGEGLRDLIEKFRLHTVTCLTLLTRFQKHALIDRDIVLCKDILDDEHVLREIGLNTAQADKVLEEIRNIYATRS